jgi:hypothetical protein
VIGIALLIRGGTVLASGLLVERTEWIANGSLMTMLGAAILLFDKLWSQMSNNNVQTQQQLLLLRSELLRLRNAQSSSPESGDAPVELAGPLPESFGGRFTAFWGGVSSRTVQWVSTVVVLTGAVVAGVTLTESPWAQPRIKQVDEWRFTSSGTVSARSQIRFERSPAEGHFVTVALPYPTAELRSVTSDGRPLQFAKLDWRRYEIEMPIGSFPWRPPEVVATWEFPVDSLARVGRGFRTTLCSLLPVNSYRLELVADEGSGYELRGQPAGQPFVPFNSGTRYDKTFFGSCLLIVHKTAPSESESTDTTR